MAFVRLASAAVVVWGATAAAVAAPATPLEASDLSIARLTTVSSQALAELFSMYNSTTGWFGPTKSIPYWTTASESQR